MHGLHVCVIMLFIFQYVPQDCRTFWGVAKNLGGMAKIIGGFVAFC